MEKYRTQLEKRHKEFMNDKELNIIVVNTKHNWNEVVEVKSLFKSVEEAEHKIALDIMTNAFYRFTEPIKIYVSVIKK